MLVYEERACGDTLQHIGLQRFYNPVVLIGVILQGFCNFPKPTTGFLQILTIFDASADAAGIVFLL